MHAVKELPQRRGPLAEEVVAPFRGVDVLQKNVRGREGPSLGRRRCAERSGRCHQRLVGGQLHRVVPHPLPPEASRRAGGGIVIGKPRPQKTTSKW